MSSSTYRDQWLAAAEVLREHADKMEQLAVAAPQRPSAAANALKVAVCEYLLKVNEDHDTGNGHMFIPPTAINWLGDGIVNAILVGQEVTDGE